MPHFSLSLREVGDCSRMKLVRISHVSQMRRDMGHPTAVQPAGFTHLSRDRSYPFKCGNNSLNAAAEEERISS
jgi:hypothetical protein